MKKKFTLFKERESSGALFKRGASERVIFAVVFAVLLVYAISLLYPFFWMITNSFKDSAQYAIDVAQKKSFMLPKEWLISNYIEVFESMDEDLTFGTMFLNSLWYTIIPGYSLLFPATCAYCLAKFNFPFKRLLYALAIFTMTIPIIGTMGSYYKLIVDIGVYDTPLYIIATSIGGLGGFNFMVFYGFFKNISWTYAEAVYIDGGNDFTVFFRVMLPQAMPMLSLLFIMGCISRWNDYMTMILYLPSYQTVSSGMYTVSTSLIRTGRTPIYFAGLTISIIPILVLFIAFGDKMMRSVSIGGIKG